MSVEDTYQKKTQLEHILLRPDTYVGSTEFQDQQIWVLASDEKSFENRQIKYVPALYKIFDEILVNAADNYKKDKRMKKLDVVIDAERNMISVQNDGKGIPVQIHKDHNIYVPELVFGHLLTSSNYNDSEKKITGGRNGYGAKLTNIFSTKFIVETADSKLKKKFTMTWTKNMSEQSEATISQYTESDFTRVTFYPDLKKFHMKVLDKDIVDLLKKRVYDMAGVIGGNVKVSLNGRVIDISSFSDYTDFYLRTVTSSESEIVKVFDNKGTNNERWEVIVSLSEGQFQQVSFVNSICTSKGGTHVNYLTDQLTDKLMETLKKKEKNITIKPFQVKSHMWIFVNCSIENPSFDSQTKETLTLRQQDFGSSCDISDKLVKELIKSNIINHILLQARAKEQAKMAKTLSGKKQGRLLGVPKLEDANDAGTKNAETCTLIVTEGDSAKALAMSGIEVVGRDKYGVFPLKGKMLNVRDSTSKQITENVEIQNIIKVMGMRLGTTYENVKSLRYGSIMIMADQDHDGSHIKGLFINFVQTFWPSLYQMPGFLKEFITPIVKVKKGSQRFSFFSIADFRRWRESCANAHLWTTKYYKGLGTSTDQEAQEYFNSVNRHTIEFRYNNKEDDDSIDLAFNKKRAEDRKEWLVKFDPEENVDHTQKTLTYKDFVHKELINFSISDNIRSIPSICDGLKPGQRKILFACFKRNLKQEIKVAQLSGYVAEHSAYHHGEASLAQTIIGMAQNFVGSNNINYLLPIGQFGSRNQGGKEAASARYIHTSLNKITRLIFPEPDDHILTYLDDDGQPVEPIYYIPIIPTSLINGAEGIGTGWSTSIPCYNPRQLVYSIEKRMLGVPFAELLPWYKGFTGEISSNEKSQITIKGRCRVVNSTTIEITELPANKWIRDFKNFLEEKLESTKDKEAEIEDLKEYHAGNRVHFVIKMSEKQLEKAEKEGLDKYFKLSTTIPTTNMVLFNAEGKINRYANMCEILEEFYEVRLQAYQKRKGFLISRLQRELAILSNKMKFILAVINESLRIRNVKRKDLIKELRVQGFTQMKNMPAILSTKQSSPPVQGEETNSPIVDEFVPTSLDDINPKEYHYLLNLPMWSLTFEKVEEIKAQQKQKQDELSQLNATEPIDIWKDDLRKFIECLDELEEEEEKEMIDRMNKNRKGGKAGKPSAQAASKKKPAQKKRANNSDDDDDGDDDNDMDIENDDDSSDYDNGKKKKAQPKKSTAASTAASSKSKGLDNFAPQLSIETGISSKTNQNNKSLIGFLSKPATSNPSSANNSQTTNSTKAGASAATSQLSAASSEYKKPQNHELQNTLERYSFKKDAPLSQNTEESNSQSAVLSLSQSYSMSLEDRIKLRMSQGESKQSQSINLSQLFRHDSEEKKDSKISIEEEEEEQFKFNSSASKANKLSKPKNEDFINNLDYLDELLNDKKRTTPDLSKQEPQLDKKRITPDGPKKVPNSKEKTIVKSDPKIKKNTKSKVQNSSEDDKDSDAFISSESSEEDQKKGKKKLSKQSHPKQGAPKGRLNGKAKDDSPQLELSEDEDINDLKSNEVIQSRTRGKRNPLPRKLLVDNSDNDDFDDEEEDEEEEESNKVKAKKPSAAVSKPNRVLKKVQQSSSDDQYF